MDKRRGIYEFARELQKYGMEKYEYKERAAQILIAQAEKIEKLEDKIAELESKRNKE